MTQNLLIDLHQVAKSFKATDGKSRLILDKVDFQLKEGEIVALLGKSGSGKSTLLRIMAGLIPADKGKVAYRDKAIFGPVAGVAIVCVIPLVDRATKRGIRAGSARCICR